MTLSYNMLGIHIQSINVPLTLSNSSVILKNKDLRNLRTVKLGL